MNRSEAIQQLQQPFDVCIIGGGITGAGILAKAVEMGYKAVLLERNDFASGTSSRSSKMIHGGLRYLKSFQFGLVREALLERGQLLQLYPHLVKPLPYILPSYHSKADLLVKDAVLEVYDRLGGKKGVPPHRRITRAEVLQKLPGFKSEGLKGGILYWDASTNDALLTLQVIADAVKQGGYALNYMPVTGFIKNNGQVTAARCTDELTGNTYTINASLFINATGVWTDEVLATMQGTAATALKPSKGVHVLVPTKQLPDEYVAIVQSVTGDKRFVYNLPWQHGLSILGTTDTEYTGPTDKVEASPEDVQYILDAFNAAFPGLGLSRQQVVGVYAGLRPMLGTGENKESYSRSREYSVWWSGTNFLNIAGGKLTSFLSMAENCMKAAWQRFPSKHSNAPANLPAYSGPWAETYGADGALLEDICSLDKGNSERLWDEYGYTKAEVIFFTRYRFARTLADMLTRRTTITYAMKQWNEPLLKKVAAIMNAELGLDDSHIPEQINQYRLHWQEYHPNFLN